MAEVVPHRWISGFWRRVLAFFLDTLLLGLVGFILGFALESVFIQLGQWARLIGLVISLGYFGIMNSRLAGGQTLGKKACGIKVVDSTNNPIGLGRSLLRYFVLAIPAYLNGIQLPQGMVGSIAAYVITIAIFGGYLSILYLFVFNRVTRQSLHDLVVGTYVVHEGSDKTEVGSVWTGHFVVVGLLFAVSLLVPILLNRGVASEPLNELFAARDQLLMVEDVRSASVTAGTTTFKVLGEAASATDYVSVNVVLSSDRTEDRALAKHLATLVLESYPETVEKDSIKVVLSHGYDIGIWSWETNHTHGFVPGDLVKK